MLKEFLLPKKIIAAVAVSGVLAAGCDTTENPYFPPCTDRDNTPVTKVSYLQRVGYHNDTGLKIGDNFFRRDNESKEIIWRDGVNTVRMMPDIIIPIPVQPNGREYVVDFSGFENFIKATIVASCPE